MSEYKSNISYVEPAVSYFDKALDAENTLVGAFAPLAAIAVVAAAAVLTSMRGSQNTLKRLEYV